MRLHECHLTNVRPGDQPMHCGQFGERLMGNESNPYADGTLFQQREWLQATLASIGNAVITTDTNGGVTYLTRWLSR